MNKIRDLLITENISNLNEIFKVIKKVQTILGNDSKLYFNSDVNWDEFFSYFASNVEESNILKIHRDFEITFIKNLNYPTVSAFDGLNKEENITISLVEENIDKNVLIMKELVYLRFLFQKIDEVLLELIEKEN